MGRTHLAITVELVNGSHTWDLRPMPGRVLIASHTATYEQFAEAIDDAFARRDRNHLHEFTLADGTTISPARWWDGEQPDRSLGGASRLCAARILDWVCHLHCCQHDGRSDGWLAGCCSRSSSC